MNKKIACMVGRFNPLHLGHQWVIENMIADFGVENCVVVIGSSQEFGTENNPLSYEQREYLIKKIFPGLKVFSLKDFDSDEEWFEELKKILNLSSDVSVGEVLFYGGSNEDLWYLKKFGLDYKIIDRKNGKFKEISATEVRKKISEGESLTEFVDEKIVDLVLEYMG